MVFIGDSSSLRLLRQKHLALDCHDEVIRPSTLNGTRNTHHALQLHCFAFKQTDEIAVEILEEFVDVEEIIGINLGHLFEPGPFLGNEITDDLWLLLFHQSKNQTLGAAVTAFHSHNPNLIVMINDLDIAQSVRLVTNRARDAG
jgi:hypothetical protein